MSTVMPFIQRMNRNEPEVAFGQLPDAYQQLLKELYARGVVVEVYGKKSRTWGRVNQQHFVFTNSDYYRLHGAAHAVAQVPDKTAQGKGRWIFVDELQLLPEETIAVAIGGKSVFTQIRAL